MVVIERDDEGLGKIEYYVELVVGVIRGYCNL